MKKISCKKTERMIPDYLNKNLSNSDLILFMNHIDNCKSCKEELSIQFLISEGLITLNEGGSFNLSEALNSNINRAHRYILFVKRLFWVRNIALFLVVIAMLVCAYLGYIYILA